MRTREHLPVFEALGLITKVSFGDYVSEEEAEEKGEEFEMPEGETDELTHVVPERYNIAKDSGIKVTVKDGANDIPIPLTTDGGGADSGE